MQQLTCSYKKSVEYITHVLPSNLRSILISSSNLRRFPSDVVLQGFPTKPRMYLSYPPVPVICPAPLRSSSLIYHPINIWWRPHIMQQFTVRYFPASCYFPRLRPKYSETCLSWPQTVPETVVNISKWSTYTNVSQNNFQPHSYFISCLIYSQSSTSAVLNLYSI